VGDRAENSRTQTQISIANGTQAGHRSLCICEFMNEAGVSHDIDPAQVICTTAATIAKENVGLCCAIPPFRLTARA
jgi:hypothetical protein